jgi:polysaccharide deacetylase 2 family uncharacterized protein YibQ
LLTGKLLFGQRSTRRLRVFPFLFPLILFTIICTTACSWFKKKPADKVDAARVEHELREAVEAAGGTDAWIKPPAAAKPGARGGATEVLVARDSFEKVIEAARSADLREGLRSRVNTQHTTNGARQAEFRIESGKQLVAQWIFSEVPRIRRAAIIIDDLGEDEHAAQRLLKLPYPLTFSVLPDLPHSRSTAEEAFRGGREVMLHLPMEPEPGAPASPGPGEIKVGMTNEEVARLIASDLNSVPHVRGVNNHMGSRATANPTLMAEVMRVLAEKRLFFIDSRTTAATAALTAARHAGIPAFYRSVFLDDTETVDYSLGQLRQFRRVVEENGVAIAIGHPHPTTITALAQFLPELERDDIELVAASELVQLPEVARLSPPAAPKGQAPHP